MASSQTATQTQTLSTCHEPWRSFFIGQSTVMERVAEKVKLIGPKGATVLLTGETGTGKEVTARAIHAAGPRGSQPMIAVNCTALPESLLEAELFGHVRGAFTGAVQNRAGRFEQAHNSTLFLDEIGDMPMETQAKLLRVLQEREFQRIGSSETIRVDVRVIAATNVNLQDRVAQGKFREDLYYRLGVVILSLPALRDRAEDIPMLVRHFVDKISRREGIAPLHVSPDAMDVLETHTWPGNVRQLENCIEQAIALAGDRTMLVPGDFPLPASIGRRGAEGAVPLSKGPFLTLPENGIDFEETVGRIELQLLEQAMRRTGGNKTQAAEILRLKRTTLSAKLRTLSRSVGSVYP